ncbi:MAG: hypothetical protein IPJ81_05445 [Chitinophagaceae bacterium]|nr:hypothetical protein [Chitinophagaceae bacterium]
MNTPQLNPVDKHEGNKPTITTPGSNNQLNNNVSDTPHTGSKNQVNINNTTPVPNNNNDIAHTNPIIKKNEAGINLSKDEDEDATELGSLSTPNGTNNQGNAFGKKQQQNFVAQVVGPNDKPIPFANVNINKSDAQTYTDAKGNIKLVADDPFLSVDVKSAGYLPKTYYLEK